jgi:hypothetical protein
VAISHSASESDHPSVPVLRGGAAATLLRRPTAWIRRPTSEQSFPFLPKRRHGSPSLPCGVWTFDRGASSSSTTTSPSSPCSAIAFSTHAHLELCRAVGQSVRQPSATPGPQCTASASTRAGLSSTPAPQRPAVRQVWPVRTSPGRADPPSTTRWDRTDPDWTATPRSVGPLPGWRAGMAGR